MKNKNLYYYLLLFIASSLWGGSFVFTNGLLKSISPISIVFFRQVISSVFFAIICLIFFRKELKVKKKDLKIIFAFSLFEPFLYFIFETYSLQYSDPTVVAIIVATIPLFTAFLAVLYFKETFTKINILGSIISIIGIGIMLLPSFSDAHFSKIGVLLAFGAVVCSVGYGFFVKKMPNGYHSAVIITYQNIIGSMLFLPLYLFFITKNQFQAEWIALQQPVNLTYILILSILCSAVAFMFFFQGIQHLGLGKANTFTNFIPVVTAILSFFMIGEQFPVYKIFGIIVVIIGIFLVQKKTETT